MYASYWFYGITFAAESYFLGDGGFKLNFDHGVLIYSRGSFAGVIKLGLQCLREYSLDGGHWGEFRQFRPSFL